MSVTNTKIPRNPRGYDDLLARYHAEVARWCEVIADLVDSRGNEREELVSQSLRYVNAIDRQRIMEIESSCIKEMLMQIRYDTRRINAKVAVRAASPVSIRKTPSCGGFSGEGE